MIAYNIQWDIDPKDTIEELGLPKTVTVPAEISDDPEYVGPDRYDQMVEHISDWLSDTYQFCHAGFELEENWKDIGPVYENRLTSGVCGIVYRKEVSDRILEIQDKYLDIAKDILIRAASEERISLNPGQWYYGFLFGACIGFYADDKVHGELEELKRPYRKEVKDVIMHNPDSCFTYDWTMSDYEEGVTHPVYVHYTNPYDAEGKGAWKPEVAQRLKYVEPSAKIQDRGRQSKWLYNTLEDEIRASKVRVDEYKEFYVCSYEGAKQLASILYLKETA